MERVSLTYWLQREGSGIALNRTSAIFKLFIFIQIALSLQMAMLWLTSNFEYWESKAIEILQRKQGDFLSRRHCSSCWYWSWGWLWSVLSNASESWATKSKIILWTCVFWCYDYLTTVASWSWKWLVLKTISTIPHSTSFFFHPLCWWRKYYLYFLLCIVNLLMASKQGVN